MNKLKDFYFIFFFFLGGGVHVDMGKTVEKIHLGRQKGRYTQEIDMVVGVTFENSIYTN